MPARFPMTPAPDPAHCGHECVCIKYIDHTNTGATPNRICNGEYWAFKPCKNDTRKQPPADVLAELGCWLKSESRIAFEPETRTFMVRLNKKIAELRQQQETRQP